MDLHFKTSVYNACFVLLQSKINAVVREIESLQESMNSESKSTAGDKHETGRAMIQLEIEKLGTQLKEVELQKNQLSKIDISKTSEVISKGSLIETDKGYLFLAIGIGKVNISGTSVFVISPESPLGTALTGKRSGNQVEINHVTYQIKKVI